MSEQNQSEPLTEVCLAGIQARVITNSPDQATSDRRLLWHELERLQFENYRLTRELRHTEGNLRQLRVAANYLSGKLSPDETPRGYSE